MEKNTILALIIIGLVLLLWPVYMKKIAGVKELPQKQVVESEVQKTDDLNTKEDQKLSSKPAETVPLSIRSDHGVDYFTREAKNPDTVVVETDLFRGKLSSAGGGTIVSWKLKKYNGNEGEWVELVPDSGFGNLGIILGMDLSHTVFDVEFDTLGAKKTYRFVHEFKDGGRIEKAFFIQNGTYSVDLEVRLISLYRSAYGEGYTVQWASGLSPTEKNIKDDEQFYQAYALQGGEILKTKEKSTDLKQGVTDWVAIRTKYFIVAIIPREPKGQAAKLEGKGKTMIPYGQDLRVEWKKLTAQLVMPLENTPDQAGQFSLYLGPMDYPQLKALGAQVEKTMNFGMAIIRPFSIAFYYTLQFLYTIVHNYGWAIVIFSILIKIVLHPLTRKSFQSMRAMQELQPKVEALREKYKNDTQRMNQETMKLYKQHGVNPMGGCLPVLLQMPVLFALFNLFRTTIMLRQASFLGLIKDLSAPDGMIGGKIHVLPILMGITMVIQQKQSTQNPQQKAMAYFMPIFMVFIFYRLSAGLNLYYLMFNILTIAHELIIKKHK